MRRFLKLVFAAFLGIGLFFLFFLILISVVGSFSDGKPSIKDDSILYLKLDKPIVDKDQDNPLEGFDFMTLEPNPSIGLNSILRSIEKASRDENIEGILLEPTFISAGMATVEEIRDALEEFKKSGKWIVAYSEMYMHKSYYLSSVADKVYFFPEGMFEFTGLHANIMFFKNALKKLGIEAQIIRHGKFKSAVEPFMLEKMSAENRAQTTSFVSDLWNKMLREIAISRNISEQNLQTYADNISVRKAEDALELGFVDSLIYKDELIELLKNKTNKDSSECLNTVKLSKYKKVADAQENHSLEKVAIVYAQGEIRSGKGNGAEVIGSETTSKLIRKAREDEDVKAIVLRVNSGGGSALASDVMWREMKLAKAQKPVVVSMGDVAASGGYYIACESDAIFASENTITGSIGVFGMIPNMKEMLNNKLGLTFDGVKTAENADLFDLTRPLTEQQRDIIQGSVVETYQDFIGKVSEGRGLSVQKVDSIGQGRVWSGEDALEIGLIDEFGGLQKAVKKAAELAELEDYKTVDFPKKKELQEAILEQLMGEDFETRFLKSKLGAHYQTFQQFVNIQDMSRIQARVPFAIEIK